MQRSSETIGAIAAALAKAQAELTNPEKALMPEDAKEATGHGVRAKRSKSGAVSFDLLEQRDSHAAV